jgi:hypothetical protein
MAQRAFLERAAELVIGVTGPAIQLGFGDGAAYDHLREILRRREIIVFDRGIGESAGAVPDADHRVLGDPRETLPQVWERFSRSAALAHLNFSATSSTRLAAELAPLVAPLLRAGAVVVSELAIDLPGWEPLPPPEGVREGRHYLYRAS